MTPRDADMYGVSDGKTVQVKAGSGRGVIFDQVVVRVRNDFSLEFHIDMDEANAAEINTGDKAGLLAFDLNDNGTERDAPKAEKASAPVGKPEETVYSLVTEKIVLEASKSKKPLYVNSGTVITPLARDVIKELGVEVKGVV